MYLYPCVVLGDFDVDRTNSTITTEHLSKWSTTDGTNLAPTIASTQISHGSQRAMKIACAAPDNDWDGDGDDDRVQKGIAGTDFTSDYLINPYGADESDLSWCTNLGAWMYSDNVNYSGENTDAFQMYVTNNIAGTYVRVDWDLPEIGRWHWVSNTPAVGTFAANGDNIEICGFSVDDSGALDAKDVYVSGFVAYKADETNEIANPDWRTGIYLSGSRVSWKNVNSFSVSGYILSKYYREFGDKLHNMKTQGAVATPSYRTVPHWQSLGDHSGLKPYLMKVDETDSLNLQATNPQYTSMAIPVIITNVTTNYTAKRGCQLLQFTLDCVRYGGVIL